MGNDETFEHETQATTGSTTGAWLVTFGAGGCERCAKLEAALDGIQEDLQEIYAVAAYVDRADSTGLWKRFGLKKVPTTQLFSKGWMYTYEGAEDGPELVKFVNDRLNSPKGGRKIPLEPGFVDVL